ncbi:ELMO domain-containing protein 3 isoform 8-T8 [Amazona ochrocephala]
MNGGAGGSERPEERQRFPPPGRSLPLSALGQNGLLQALVQGAEPPAGDEISEELQRAREEWEAVEEIRSGTAGPGARGGTGGGHSPHLLQGGAAVLPDGGGARGAQGALDDNESVHMRILQTIYKKLTRSRLGCPRYGAHWEELGFQGTDPGTDLRGTGMLALMQLLFFVMDPQMLPLALDIFRLSQHETQEFPFGIMSVNITRIVLQALREERLSRECNRRQQVIAVLNDLYAAAFLRLYRTWKGQHKTIADSCFLLKELELSTKRKPKQLLKSLEAFVSRGPTAEGPAPPSPPSPSSRELSFTGLCDLEGELRLV